MTGVQTCALPIYAGLEPSVVVSDIQKQSGNWGLNVATDTYGDMLEMGVIDPTKVTKTALINAASVAAMVLTTECSIVKTPGSGENKVPMSDLHGMM